MFKYIFYIFFVCASTIFASSPIIIVNKSHPQAVIKYAKKDAPEGHWAYKIHIRSSKELAGIMRDYLQKVSGALLKTGPDVSGDITIHIGMTDYAAKLKDKLQNMDEDEFIISFPDRKNIVILGKYQNGIEWGVLEFLERYAGVKFLFPGALGEYIPHSETIAVPVRDIREKPVFIHRHFTVRHKDKEEQGFIRFHRDRQRVRFHHAMGILVNPVNHYTNPKDFPYFYPVQNGKRMIPTKKSMFMGWQPCFSAEGLAEALAPRMIKKLKRYSNCVSLGINDNGGFCECAKCRKDPNRNYYKFCNKVATLVSRGMEGKNYHIGLLGGYSGKAPQMKLNEHLVPFVTKETFIWLDPEKEKSVKKEISEWKKVSKNLGLYDYIYGEHYLVPRIFFHHHANVLRYLAANNIRYYYAEMGFDKHFQEGPKAYLVMKLLWNPDLDVDKLLDDWYECAVGKKAAPFLKQYFECWENFWCRKIPHSAWFNKHKNRTYLRYYDNIFLDEINEEMLKKLELLLDKTVENSITPLQKKRAEMFRSHFMENAVVIRWRQNSKILAANKNNYTVLSSRKYDFSNKRIWGHWRHPSSRAEMRWDSRGHGSMLIDKSKDALLADPGNAVFIKIPVVKPGEKYRISARVMVEDVAPGAAVELTVRWRKKDRRTWVNFMSMWNTVKLVPKPGKWTDLTIYVAVPATRSVGAMHITLGTARSVKGGKFWFDDVKISKLGLKR